MSTSTVQKLAIRPYPHPDEGARGYVQRLATVNGLRCVGSMNPQREFLSAQELSCLIGRDDGPFWAEHPESSYWRKGRPIRNSVWNWKSRKCCPKCLLESSYWRIEWELDDMMVCPKHQLRLVNTCPSCNQLLSWGTQVLAECRCGFNITQIDPEPCTEAERLLGLVLTATLGHNECPESHHFLKHLDTWEAIRLTEYFGAISTAHVTSSPSSFATAAIILNEWPAKYRSLLGEIQKANKSATGVPSIYLTYGKLYTALYKYPNLDSLGFVRDEFESHINENWHWPIDQKSRRLPIEVRNNSGWIPASQASMELNIRYKRLLKLVTEANIESETVVLESGRRYLSIRAKDLKILRQRLSNKITLAQATTMLGISKNRVRSLIEWKVLSTDSEKQSTAEKWEITSASLRALLARGEETPEIDEVGKDHYLLKNLAKSGLRITAALPALLNEILSGRIDVAARLKSGKGIGGWVIARSSYESWKKTRIQLENEHYSIQEAAETLQIRHDRAYQFVNCGLLKTIMINRDGYSARVVTKANLDEFRCQYVLGRDLAKELGTTSNKIARLLGKLNIHPPSALQKVVSHQAVFEKTTEFLKSWASILKHAKPTGTSPS